MDTREEALVNGMERETNFKMVKCSSDCSMVISPPQEMDTPTINFPSALPEAAAAAAATAATSSLGTAGSRRLSLGATGLPQPGGALADGAPPQARRGGSAGGRGGGSGDG